MPATIAEIGGKTTVIKSCPVRYRTIANTQQRVFPRRTIVNDTAEDPSPESYFSVSHAEEKKIKRIRTRESVTRAAREVTSRTRSD